MENPPVTEQSVTSAELDVIFVEHDVERMLRSCVMHVIVDETCGRSHPLHPNTVAKLGYKYRLGGLTVAVIFYYTHGDARVTRHIRMLRINDTKYVVMKQPPVHVPFV